MSENLPLQLKKSVVLVGIMGCGKSAIGSRLAMALEIPFVDTDKVIEDNAEMSIAEIFEKHGEAYFRKLEKETIADILGHELCIMATGGGAFMNDEIRAIIKKKAVSVCIRADFDVILERVSRKNTRPLLEKGDKATILRQLIDERCPVYEQADFIVDSSVGEHDEVVNEIIGKLK